MMHPKRKTHGAAPAPAYGSVCEVDFAIIESLKSIPEILEIHISHNAVGATSALVVVAEKDFSVERAIYEKQLEIIDACPDFEFNLRVISLRGRELSQVVAPTSKLVFQRTA